MSSSMTTSSNPVSVESKLQNVAGVLSPFRSYIRGFVTTIPKRTLAEEDTTGTGSASAESVSSASEKKTKDENVVSAENAETKGQQCSNAVDRMQAGKGQLAPCERKRTGVVYHESMVNHVNPWDPGHIESPTRLSECWNLCNQKGLISRCKILVPRSASLDEIGLVHDEKYISTLKSTQNMTDKELEATASQFQDVYLCRDTYLLALLSAGCTLVALDAIMTGECENAFAFVRPPGHHSWSNQANGFCVFNNVAIAAKYARKKYGLSRILIVDYDVHHGQGSQYTFYDDPNVLYFSIHRFEYGKFWPNLRESDFTAIGSGSGTGFNINFPLNKIGCNESDFLTIIDQVLLPVALEFSPQLILVSCGIDAGIGDPEGLMLNSPAFYSHVTRRLLSLATAKVCCVLEGGYCLQSLAEGVAHVVGSLLGDPCPPLPYDVMGHVEPLIFETLINLAEKLAPYWSCMRKKLEVCQKLAVKNCKQCVFTLPPFEGDVNRMYPKEPPYPTRGMYRPQTDDVKAFYKRKVEELVAAEFVGKQKPTAVAHDARMDAHFDHVKSSLECPERVNSVFKFLTKHKSLENCVLLNGSIATEDELALVHTKRYIDFIRTFDSDFDYVSVITDDSCPTYLCKATYNAAEVAVGTLLSLTEAVVEGRFQNGLALIRPPGHLAEPDGASGFCIFNNCAIAAKYALQKWPETVKKILLIDWDPAFGAGTSKIFAEDSSVLYISLHNAVLEEASIAASSNTGSGKGVGFNVNIPFSGNPSDADYLFAFHQIVLPLAYEFSPDLIFVAAGFVDENTDGSFMPCSSVYAYMVNLLSCLACGRLILLLEGGFDIEVLKKCLFACLEALKNNSIAEMPSFSFDCVSSATISAVADLVGYLKPQWKYLSSLLLAPNFK